MYFEHVVNKFFFVEWIYNAEDRADQVIPIWQKNYIFIYKGFAVVPIDEAAGLLLLFVKDSLSVLLLKK